MAAYPSIASARDAFVISRRPAQPSPDPWRFHGVTVEQEPDESGTPCDVVTVFLTGRQCPWRCAMCDLWQYTTDEDTPLGAIPHQIRTALDHVRGQLRHDRPRHIKLYNAGSFFDPHAVPPADYRAVARDVAGFSRVVVESHPALVGPRVDQFRLALSAERVDATPSLEVAMGLETAHPGALERLNKRMTLEQFRHAAGALASRDVALRAFVLVSPPFVPAHEQADWLGRSVDAAFECGASIVSLIPMRAGNGTVEALADDGEYRAPTLDTLEAAMDAALSRSRGRVFADVWDLERLMACPSCFRRRKARLEQMNRTQRAVARVSCPMCSSPEVQA